MTFFKCPQINPNHLIVFFNSYRFLRWWALCSRNGNFPALCGCEGILGRKSTDDIVSFHVPFMFLSCCINFLSCCINILSCAFHVPFIMHSCPVIVRRYHIKHTGGYPPERALFCDRFASVLEESAGAIFRGSCTCTLWWTNIAMENGYL